MAMKQLPDESLRAYLARFNAAAVEVFDLDQTVAVAAVINGMKNSRLTYSLLTSTPANLSVVMEKASKHMEAEEAMDAKREPARGAQSDKKRSEPEKRTRDQKGTQAPRLRQVDVTEELRQRKTFKGRFDQYEELNTTRVRILELEKNKGTLRKPEKMRAPPERRDKNRYCEFHEDHGHETADCVCLKDEIEELIRAGQLRQYRKGEGRQERKEERRSRTPPRKDHDSNVSGIINVISGGVTAAGEGSRARKAYAREVLSLAGVGKCPRESDTICFSEKDMEGVATPHDDPVVVSMKIANFMVKRILIDGGSSADILFHEAFANLGLLMMLLSLSKDPSSDSSELP